MDLPLPHRWSAGFDGLYGLVVTDAAPGSIRGEVAVGAEHLQPAGLVHGGVYAAIAESLASVGTLLGVGEDHAVMGSSNLTSFMRPIIAGTIHAAGEARHRGRTSWVWEVECADDAGRACVLSRVTIAVRDRPPDATS